GAGPCRRKNGHGRAAKTGGRFRRGTSDAGNHSATKQARYKTSEVTARTNPHAQTPRRTAGGLVFPLLRGLILQLRTQRVYRREAVAPSVRTAGIKDCPTINEVTGISLVGMHGGVERRAPATIDDTDRRFRITARRYRPNHLFHVRRIDILID